jgi:glycosyltransferase involved in cell wall biosynthesis
MALTVLQVLPALDAGGVERGTVEVARELCRRGHRALVVSAGGRMVPELEEAGARHITWAIGKKSPLTLNYVRPLRQLLLSEKVDILHARSRLPAWIAHMAWRKLEPERRPRFLTTVHGPYRANRYSAIMTRGERVIAISNWISEYVREHYPEVDPSRLRVIPRGVDRQQYPHGFRPSEEWMARWQAEVPQAQNRFVITIPARITRRKGHEDFIGVVNLLKQRGLAVHGLIVGGAEASKRKYRDELKSLIGKLRLGEDISMLGHRTDLREIISVSNAVVSLVREPEAFGRTTIEALSLGVPVVGYDLGGTAEILRNVFPDGLVTAGNIDAAAARLAQLLASPLAPPPYHPYTLQRMLDAELAVYDELVTNVARAAAIG